MDNANFPGNGSNSKVTKSFKKDLEADEEYSGAGDISLMLNSQLAPKPEPSDIPFTSNPAAKSTLKKGLLLPTTVIEKRTISQAFGDDAHDNLSRQSKRFKDLSGHDDFPMIIAHCPAAWQMMKEKQLAWGVSFEIARLLSKGQVTQEMITPQKLEQLQGLNKNAAPRVIRVFANASIETAVDPAFVQEMMANSPWEELDREEEALSLGPYEGIGNNPRFPGWHGGKVVFQGQLVDENGKFRITLDSCTLGGSSRLTRRFGSWSILRIKIPREIFFGNNKEVISFFLRPLVIWDRVFRVFDAKDSKLFLYCTNEAYPSGPVHPDRMSLENFIEWHNPLTENKNQLMTKWAARMCLGLSTSIPGPRLLQKNILSENDIVSSEGSDMTDGCGLSSKNIHIDLSHNLDLQSPPTAFQFRLAGYKGMSLLNDNGPISEDMQISCRPSQRKISYGENADLDPAKLTIDVLRISHMRTPAQLSREVIINLSENGVPRQIFKKLLSTSIRTMVEGLTTWDGPDAMFKLWVNVERAGGVLATRRARESVGEARVRGYTNKSPDEMDDVEDKDEESDQELEDKITDRRSIAWWPDNISGCPSGLEETILTLLEAGFTPQENPLLRDVLHKLVVSKIENRLQKFKFDVEQSCVAFAVPDSFGVLGPDEIQVKSSSRNLKTNDGLLTDTLLGDVLVTRNPCRIPTDVRKVKAVEHPSLRNLVDVVVFSVQGQRRLIDFLAGGDYDGDKVLVIWSDRIVSPFQNADEKHAIESKGLDMAFDRDKETVDDFLIRVGHLTGHDRRRALQKYLLPSPLVDPSLRGKYSNMHENATYQLGYKNPRTVKLAYKFCRVMDSAKTGWRIKPESLKADLQQYNERRPSWKEFIGKKDKAKTPTVNTSNLVNLERDPDSPSVKGKFVMDSLVDAARREKDKVLAKMNTIFAPLPVGPDPVLTAPWDDLERWAERGKPEVVKMKKKDLGKIAIHVQTQYRVHATLVGQPTKQNHHFTTRPIQDRQDRLRKASKGFVSGPTLEDLPTIADEVLLARVRASYAYKYDAEKKANDGGWSRFPFNVAMRDLCDIKARKSGNGIHKVVQNSFYERFKLVVRN